MVEAAVAAAVVLLGQGAVEAVHVILVLKKLTKCVKLL
jgi:hypothetical protein